MANWSEAELEDRLSRPTPGTIAAVGGLEGELLLLGVGGKMGPSLARMARRSAEAAGNRGLRIVGVSRFSDGTLRETLEREGIETIGCDLLDPAARSGLPPARNVLFMLGYKFGAQRSPSMAWAMNTYVPGALAELYRTARQVAFSTGNVYPFTPVEQAPTEQTPCAPVGEYATTAWGRERMFEHVAEQFGTPVCLLRLNYAVDLRYGVPVDLARQIVAGEPIDLSTPYVNMVWQGYANAVALEAFELAGSPAEILNLTGRGHHRVRALAEGLGRRLGVEPRFTGTEGERSLLNDASRCHARFGPPEIDGEELLDLVADWLKAGGRTLGKPTKFQVRDGQF